jgi:hypothetical protein
MLQKPPSRIKMMKYRILLSPLLLCLSCTAVAQVYKCTDAEGNVTFGDTQSADCKEVQVEESNVADPVNVPANAAPEPTPEPKVVKQGTSREPAVEKDYDDDSYRVVPRVHRRSVHHRRGHRRR